MPLPLCPLQLTSLQAEVSALLEAHWQATSGTAAACSLKGGHGITPRPVRHLNGLMVGAYPIERILGDDGMLQLEQAVDRFRWGVGVAPLCWREATAWEVFAVLGQPILACIVCAAQPPLGKAVAFM